MPQKKIWVMPLSLDALNQRAEGSFSDYLHIAFTEFGNDFLVASMPIHAKHCQPLGLLHGGASAALAETVASAAANYCIDSAKAVCVGLELNINHLRPVRGGVIRAIAKPFHLGKTTQVWDIQIFDERKKRTSVARLTLSVLEKKNLREESSRR